MKWYVWVVIAVLALLAIYNTYRSAKLRKVVVDDKAKTISVAA